MANPYGHFSKLFPTCENQNVTKAHAAEDASKMMTWIND
mgnify:FL=1|jgi:hypothetical protein